MQADPQRLPPLDRLAVFDAAARHLPFTKAAAERFLTQSAVAVAEALSCLRTAVAVIRGPLTRSRREVLTLTTTPGLASLWLIPRLAGFMAAHPPIDVRIDATHDLRSLASEGCDVAIRYGNRATLGGTPPFKGAWASARSHALVTTTAAARRAAAQALCAWLLTQAREAS